MNIFVGQGSNMTVFGIVNYAQRKFKGQSFCALEVRLEKGRLRFYPCSYQPIRNEELPNWVKFISAPGEPPCVFEHFLQSVRKKYPGISFQEIFVESADNYQLVEPRQHSNR